MRIYGDTTSGNCLKVKYTADLLGLPYTWVVVSALDGETKSPEFLAKNPMGQIPVVELADGRHLAQSNAIIRYLARGTSLLPDDAFIQAKIDEWMFWEQYSHEPYIAVCRFHMLYLGKSKDSREAARVERGEKALDLMETQLAGRPFLVGETFTIADIALVSYTRVADEGGFDLAHRPNVRGWIERCEGMLRLIDKGSTGQGEVKDQGASVTAMRVTPYSNDDAAKHRKQQEECVIDWLKERGPDDWHRLSLGWNWDHGMTPLKWIVEQPECDKATALQVFWHSAPETALACRTWDDARKQYCHEEWMVLKGIVERWSAGSFTRSELAFNSGEQVDESGLRERLKYFKVDDFAFPIPSEMFIPRTGRQLTTLEGLNDGVPVEVHERLLAYERGLH